LALPSTAQPVKLSSFIKKYPSFHNYSFTFLNQTKSFPEKRIDWNYGKYGKLWTYNLNYFDFLHKDNFKIDNGIELIEDFINQLTQQSTGLEPYPISLRGINWIKFFSTNHINSQKINDALHAQYKILFHNIEYHLMANHLLENGFSLLFGAFYFKDISFYNKAKQILETELKEQILDDGGHFELSPMYHQIILDRLLDSVNLLQNNQRFENQDELLILLKSKAAKMLGWLQQMTLSNGDTPLFNDAAPGIAPTSQQLFDYAGSLNLKFNSLNKKLSSSGYRRFNGHNYECIVDVGQIGPSYQPGHAHVDTFSFTVNIDNRPFIVDRGISTYNPGEVRMEERGTASHNTITVVDKNSSEVWSSFRVARRANVKILEENKHSITARHDGYKRLGTIHQREWRFLQSEIQIQDTLKGEIVEGKVHFWLAPEIVPLLKGKRIDCGTVSVVFQNPETIRIIKTKIPSGYNKYMDNYKIEVQFNESLKTLISIT